MALGRRPEQRGEGQVGVRVEVLLGEEHDLAVEPDLSDGGDGDLIEVTKIHAADDRSDGPRERGDVKVDESLHDGHGGTSFDARSSTVHHRQNILNSK